MLKMHHFEKEEKFTLQKSTLSLFHYLLKLFGIFFKYTEGSKKGNIEQWRSIGKVLADSEAFYF